MTRRKTAPAAPLTRRRFVTMVAAGSAALIASAAGGQGEPPATTRKRTRRAPPPRPAATNEFEKQRAATADVLKTLRAHALPPGGEFAGAFRPVRPARRLGGR